MMDVQQITDSDRKVSMFFELLRSIYGASKYSQQWPTDLDLQAAKTVWKQEIEKYTPDELRAAINNALVQASNGEADWQWPNIGLILSGCKRYANASHRIFLPEPERKILPPQERSSRAKMLMEQIK